MAKTIPLTQGKVAIVSNEDYEYLSQWKWSFHGKYAHRSEWIKGGKGKQIHHYMHRQLMNVPKGLDTDHINGDKLDNRRENLRVCSRSQNNANMTKPSHNTSGFRGVSWDKRAKKWQARINKNGKLQYCARFEDKLSAAKAYNDKFFELYGNYAKLNIIKETT